MLYRIIGFSVRNKLIIGLMVIALVIVGIYQTTRLPVDAVPDITNNQVQVITVAPSFGANDIERLVTFPVEQANNNIPGLKEIRSFSRFGLSLVTIVFEDGIDIYWARQQVAERLQQVQGQIPQGIGTPQLGPISTGLGEIYQYVVRPKKGYEGKYSLTDLRTIQDWIVRRQLLGVKGVAEVSSFGGKLKQYEIAIQPDKLNAYGITVQDVFAALEANNQNTGGAYIEKGPTVLFIRSEGLVGSVDDIGSIAIASRQSAVPLFIRDVADVKIGYATRYGAMGYNDQGEVSGAVVMMLKGENSSEVVRNVKERVAEIQKTLPEGVLIEPFLDRTKMVNNAIRTVEQNLMEGALIVVFVLVLFLGNIRAGLLVASVIPLAMLFAICMMNLFGVSGNLMSLGALDFGLIIDGAVIIVESVMHHLDMDARHRKLKLLSRGEMNETVVGSAGKMMNSAVFGQIIILIVYLPILSLRGIEGKMFKPMAQTVAFALLGAFLLSLTYIPMMSSLVLSRKLDRKESFSDRWMRRIGAAYQKALHHALRIPGKIITAVLLLFVAALVILMNLGGEFIPSLEEGDFAVETRVLTGSNLETTMNSMQQAAHILKTRFPEVTKVVSKVGSGEVPTDPMPMEAGDMMIILKDKTEWVSAGTFPELAAKMSKALEDVPGITVSFQFPVQMRFNELMTGARQDVVIKVFGDNLDSLAVIAARIGKLTNTVQGATALYVEPVTGMSQVVIRYNRSMIAQYHLSIADVNRTVNAAFAGQSAGLVFEGERRFDMMVRMDARKRQRVEDIRQLLVSTPTGLQVPLSQLADVSVQLGPNQIQRENARRRIIVGFNVKGRDVQSIVEELKSKMEKQIRLPEGYYITYGGSFENLNEAKARLGIAVPVSLVLIFILLFFAFGSIRESLLIYTAIPLSAIGGVFLLAARGMPFSISAGVGFIALFGVAVLNGIVLIAEFNRLRKSGRKNLLRVVTEGAESRLRPVLMTACVASLGFLPMALSHGAGAEVQRPLATVVIGGLILATFLTLFVLPMLYLLLEQRSARKAARVPKTVLLLLLLTLPVTTLHAQEPLSLDSALAIAARQNLSLRSERLKTEYAKQMLHSATDLPQTNFSVDYGQVNSAFNDTRFSVMQSVAFPTVYHRQKKVLQEELSLAEAGVRTKDWEVRRSVMLTYYTLLYWQQKEALLLQADSLYDDFARKAALRLSRGESNILEKTTAENQQASISVQLREVRRELSSASWQLRYLLHTDIPYKAIGNNTAVSRSVDAVQATENPILNAADEQLRIAGMKYRLEKSRLLPGFSVAYNNNSFKGVGPDNKTYDGYDRFHSVQLGITVPLFPMAQVARIKAANSAVQIATLERDNVASQLQTRSEQLRMNFETQQQSVAYYETTGLNNAALIMQTAQRQFVNGEINYLEYVMLINQAISVRSSYADALYQLNQFAVQLQFLTTN
ncbi:MAG: CusA/CzcA family heavy metal efflux RND transporter [Chitinophagaceae bacterium]